MQNYLFEIYYQRGDKFEIIASSESEAFKIMWEAHPEYRYFDLSKVIKKEIDM